MTDGWFALIIVIEGITLLGVVVVGWVLIRDWPPIPMRVHGAPLERRAEKTAARRQVELVCDHHGKDDH